MSNKIRLDVKEATPNESPGSWRDDASVVLFFKGDRQIAAALERAILKALSDEGHSVDTSALNYAAAAELDCDE